MPAERRDLAAHEVFIKKGGRGEMTKTPINLQDLRRRLSYEVTQAITQLRNYGDYFKNPENADRVWAAVGHRLR